MKRILPKIARNALKDSKGLLAACADLETSEGWNKFTVEFDRIECAKKRGDALKVFLNPMKEDARTLHDYCNFIRNGQRGRHFGVNLPDGKRVFLSSKEYSRMEKTVAVALAEKVQVLLSPSEEGKRMRNVLKSEAKRKEAEQLKFDMASQSTQVCYAFLGFALRMKRLPLKKELNIEVNRMKHSEEKYLENGEFKALVKHLGNEYRIYTSDVEFDFDSDFNTQTRSVRRIVPADQWDKLAWDAYSRLSDLIEPLGLKGLAEAHNEKGKKARK